MDVVNPINKAIGNPNNNPTEIFLPKESVPSKPYEEPPKTNLILEIESFSLSVTNLIKILYSPVSGS